jgi:hypothetical protein
MLDTAALIFARVQWSRAFMQAEGSEMEEVVTEIATNMLAKIPSPWNPEQLKGGKSKANSKTAMHALMLQEVEHMQEIVSFCQRVRAVKAVVLVSCRLKE